MNKPRMGKGLSSLLKKIDQNEFQEINLNEIEAGEMQTRKYFNEIQELASTIKSHGVLQPIIVYKSGNKFKIVSGERRFRASKLAGLTSIPAKIVDWDNEKILHANILENVQRSNLNGIEEAKAYQKLIKDYNVAQEEIAQKIGKSRSHIANLIRLLNLPENVQVEIINGNLSIGHGKVLLQKYKNKEEILKATQEIIKNKHSVRDIESKNELKMAKNDQKMHKTSKNEHSNNYKSTITKLKNNSNNTINHEYVSIAETLSHNIGFTVTIQKENKSGHLIIDFNNDIELDKLLTLFSKMKIS